MPENKINLLLVEGNEEDRNAFARLIQDDGLPYALICARSVAEAKQILGSDSFAIVIADYFLGDGTALDILRQLSRDDLMIVTTGAGDEAAAVKIAKEGAYDYVIKDAARNYLKVLPVTIDNAIRHKRDREALRKMETRFRRLVTSNIIGVIIADTSGCIRDANDAFLRMVGYTRDELLTGKMRWDEMTPPEWRYLDEKALVQLRRYGAAKPWEKEFIRKNGARLSILCGLASLDEPDGDAVHCVCFIVDISERKKTEKALRKAHEILEVRVKQRTQELEKANKSLLSEIMEREKAEVNLRRAYEEVEEKVKERTQALETEISERIKADEALNESRRELQEYIDNMFTFNAKLDTKGNFLLVGKTAQMAAGFTPEKLMKMNFIEGPWWAFDPEVQKRVREAFKKAASGTPVQYDEQIRVFGDSILTINFSLRPVFDSSERVRYVLAEGNDVTPLKEAEQKIKQSEERFRNLVQTIPDIVYRLDREGKFIFINNSIKSIGYEPEELMGRHFGAIIHPEDILNVSRSEVLPRFIGVATGDDHAPKLFDERRTGRRATRGLEVRLLPKNKNGHIVGSVFSCGEIISIGQYDREITSEEKEFLGTVGIVRDITERKRAEEALRKAHDDLERRVQERTAELSMANEELKKEIAERKQVEETLAIKAQELERSNTELEQFAYISSHDLQEPLRKVASYAELFAEKYRGKIDKRADKYIFYMIDGVHRMKTLIHDLLAYSRVGRNPIVPEPFSFDIAVQQALSDLEIGIQESGAKITLENLPAVVADRSQMAHVMQNLIGNAIKFCGKEPLQVRIFSEDRGKEWIFGVRDNGIGIEPEYKERIFVVFQRLHTRDEYPGNGIGLAICRKIIERHGGRIWVESEPGKGSTFYFTLPKEGLLERSSISVESILTKNSGGNGEKKAAFSSQDSVMCFKKEEHDERETT